MLCFCGFGEKEFDRVPIELVRWALRKLGLDEWLIRTAMSLYTEACTVVVTDAVSSEAISGLPTELRCADDLHLVHQQ